MRQGKIADPDQQDQLDPNYKFLIKMLHVQCYNAQCAIGMHGYHAFNMHSHYN